MKKTILSLATASLLASSVFASTETDDLKAQIKALMERLSLNERQTKVNSEKADTLIEETANLQTGFAFNGLDTTFSHNGMGVAASKVYNSKSPLSIGGYGEMFYASKEDADNIVDVYRFIPYIGYKFTDNIILNTELEIEHGGADGANSGKVVIEFFYLDFLLSDAFNIQVGNVLTPMGIVNLLHEPVLFNTVQRPNTEKALLPSTWNTNGVVAYGDIGKSGFTYNAGIIQALDFNNANSGEKGQIRSARAGSSKNSVFNNAAFVGRLDYIGSPGLMLGTSVYHGTSTQGSVSETRTTIYDVHATYEKSGFKAKALYTATKIDDADKIASASFLQDGATAATGESITDANGYYVNVEYDLLNKSDSKYKLPVFVQYDYINPTDNVVNGSNSNVALDVNAETATTTVGLNFFPHEQVVLKADYAMTEYKNVSATSQDQDIFSLSFGFIF